MKKGRKSSLLEIIHALLFMALFYIWYTFSLEWYYLFVFMIIPSVVIISISGLLPKDSNAVKKSTSKKLHSKSTKSTINDIKEKQLLEMNGFEFEELCYQYFKSKKVNPRLTQKTQDHGVDLIIEDKESGKDIAIQIKHYYNSNSPVSVQTIREIDSAKKNYNCLFAEVITTSRFTRPALLEAEKRNIICRDIEWVRNKIIKWQNKK
ncbi:MAG: restriction endonuclease [Bacillales bacterium]|jgi:restriction system protein|nr:restriction endonuclease [Bacillales bacterium]